MIKDWYERVVLPHESDLACGVQPIQQQREKVVPLATGRVLEAGIGTGLNLPFYARSRVQSIIGVDPALAMHPLALRRIQQTGQTDKQKKQTTETQPLSDHSFDTIVCT